MTKKRMMATKEEAKKAIAEIKKITTDFYSGFFKRQIFLLLVMGFLLMMPYKVFADPSSKFIIGIILLFSAVYHSVNLLHLCVVKGYTMYTLRKYQKVLN